MPSSRPPDTAGLIASLISAQTRSAGTVTRYRAPLVAFARADDARFDELPSFIPEHMHPRDLLPDARSVCVFFLPFDESIVAANADGDLASEVWARAYYETNELLAKICQTLTDALGEREIRAAWEPPTHNFDPIRLESTWSHKSVAAIAGLGQFGHHHMLITQAGCAGRLGSIVLDVDTPPTPSGDGSYCSFDRGCRACIRRCPTGALTELGLDRARCYERCLENDARFPQWVATVCGKCITAPCALQMSG